MLVLLRLRRRKGISTWPTIDNLLDDGEQDGDDNGGLEGFPEHDKKNRNREQVLHDCFKGSARTNNDVREGEFRGKEDDGKGADVGKLTEEFRSITSPV